MAGTPNSTSPAIAEPVTPVTSVVQAGAFADHLDDDQVNLQLMNNHVIKRLIQDYNDASASDHRLIEGITEGVQEQIEWTQDAVDNGFQVPDTPFDERNDAANVRQINDARARIAALEEELEDAIKVQLQIVDDAVHRLATDDLNARNSTAAMIRNEISDIDAQISGLGEQAAALGRIQDRFQSSGATFNSRTEDFSRLNPLIAALEEASIPPAEGRIDGGPSRGSYESWDDYFRNQNIFGRVVNGVDAVDIKLQEIKDQMDALADRYPAPYKTYQRLIGGQALSEESIDWWKIATQVGWFILEEAAWTAAAFVVAPITGGIGTALIVSARMARRAGAIGAMVAAGINGGMRLARWYARLEDRVQTAAFNVFKRAWARVRGRTVPRQGRDAGQVNGNGDDPNSPSCVIGACALPG